MTNKFELYCWKTIFIIAIMSLIVSGCASSGHSRRGKLSEVMKKASKPSEGESTVHKPYNHNDDYYQSDDEYVHSNVPTEHYSELGSHCTISIGSGSFYENDFEDLTQVNIGLESYINGNNQAIGFYLGGGFAKVKPSSDLYNSIERGVDVFSAGFYLKQYLTPPHTFTGIYILGGIGYSRMFWSYRNSVNVDGESISSDDLEGLELFAGAGINIIQTKIFKAGIEVIPNVTFWELDTYEGFENDMFDALGSVKYKAFISLKY